MSLLFFAGIHRAIALTQKPSVRPVSRESSEALLTASLLGGNLSVLDGDDLRTLLTRRSARSARWELRVSGVNDAGAMTKWLNTAVTEFKLRTSDASRVVAAHAGSDDRNRNGWRALLELQLFLNSASAGATISEGHLCSTAWEVQSIIRMLRLGQRLDWINVGLIEYVVSELWNRVCEDYNSWNDYSLSFLVTLALLNPPEINEYHDWLRIVRTHKLLLQQVSGDRFPQC